LIKKEVEVLKKRQRREKEKRRSITPEKDNEIEY